MKKRRFFEDELKTGFIVGFLLAVWLSWFWPFKFPPIILTVMVLILNEMNFRNASKWLVRFFRRHR